MGRTITESDRATANLRCALDMHETGVEIKRQSLRRRYPDEDEASIERRLAQWLRGDDAFDERFFRRREP